ncbi:MAG: hypothetical protein KH284_00420 [Clostridiales bacterium]|nr:hypothetical protein [Clostridiales bacterium]
MSKAIFLAFPHYGHIKVQIGLLKALQQKGEELICLTEPEYSKLFTENRLPYLPYNVEHNMNLGLQSNFPKYAEAGLTPIDYISKKCMAYEDVISNAKKLAERYYIELRDNKPDYILYDCGVYMGRFLAEQFDVPAICSNTEMVETEQMIDLDFNFFLRYVLEVPTDIMSNKQLDEAKRLVEWFRKRYQKKYAVSCGFENSPNLNILYLTKSLQGFHELLHEEYVYVGYHIDDTRDAALPFTLDDGKRLIYITQGSEHKVTLEFLHKIQHAFLGTPYEVVLTVGWRNHDLMESIQDMDFHPLYIVETAPQITLLKKASLYITHGGLTGVREALLLGVPMLFTRDRKYSNQIVKMNAGETLNIIDADSETLLQKVLLIINDESYQKNAAKLGKQLNNVSFYEDAANCIINYVSNK